MCKCSEAIASLQSIALLQSIQNLQKQIDILNKEIQNLKKDTDTDKIIKEIISKLKLKGV
jgi:hypothetical protein